MQLLQMLLSNKALVSGFRVPIRVGTKRRQDAAYVPKALSAYEQKTIMTFAEVDSSYNRCHESVSFQAVHHPHK
jgi:hypothetical protein